MNFQKHTIFLILLTSSILTSQAEMVLGKQISTATDSIKIDYLTPNQISITDSIINYGKIFLNTPYRFGAKGTSSFDCSGFTSHVYRNFGYDLKRSSSDQGNQFDTVKRNQLKSGDLVFFAGRRVGSRVGHVGIVVHTNENGNFDFIHASVQKGVIISSSEEDYYKRRYIKANRVIDDLKMLTSVSCDAIPENNTVEQAMIATPVSGPAKETKKTIPAKYHQVKSGENLSIIADKYGISVTELKRKNNLKNNKIKPKQKLLIKPRETILLVEKLHLAENTKPTPIKNTEIVNNDSVSAQATTALTTHKVKKGETLFSISKLYNISIDQLKQINNLTNSKINFGDEIKLNEIVKTEIAQVEIAQVEIEKSSINKQPTILTHKVKSGESLYSISKKYSISIDELKKTNQLTNSNIQPGQKLILNKLDEKTLAKIENKKTITHKVKSGESFYSIAKIYGCTIDNLKEWNNKTENKLNMGEKLIVYPKTI